MSSHSDDLGGNRRRPATHLVIGEGEDAALIALKEQGAEVIHLAGQESEGRRLLELLATSDSLVCWPWPGIGR